MIVQNYDSLRYLFISHCVCVCVCVCVTVCVCVCVCVCVVCGVCVSLCAVRCRPPSGCLRYPPAPTPLLRDLPSGETSRPPSLTDSELRTPRERNGRSTVCVCVGVGECVCVCVWVVRPACDLWFSAKGFSARRSCWPHHQSECEGDLYTL